MNISSYISLLLKEKNHISVQGFGIFSIKKIPASINNQDNSILPPGKQITFVFNPEAKDDGLFMHMSETEKISLFSAELEVKKLINQWQKKLSSGESFYIDKLGEFRKNNEKPKFYGDRIDELSPDFYGLEKIKMAEINNIGTISRNTEQEPEDIVENYKFNMSVLWIFLFIIPVLGIFYFTFTKREIIFGEKSFEKTPLKKAATKKVEIGKYIIKKDTLKTVQTIPSKKNNNFSK